MARRGEAGPIRGKTAAVYAVGLPSGAVAKIRSFNVHSDDALAITYRTPEGAWKVAGIVHADYGLTNVIPRDGSTITPARRVK